MRKQEHYNTIITLYMKCFKVESLNKSYKRKQTIVLKHCSIVLIKKYKTSIDEYLRQINFSIQFFQKPYKLFCRCIRPIQNIIEMSCLKQESNPNPLSSQSNKTEKFQWIFKKENLIKQDCVISISSIKRQVLFCDIMVQHFVPPRDLKY